MRKQSLLPLIEPNGFAGDFVRWIVRQDAIERPNRNFRVVPQEHRIGIVPTTSRSVCVFTVYYTVDGFIFEQVDFVDMSTSERDERGRFSAKHTDDEVLDAVQKHEPAGTSEIAEELGIERPSADYRLRQLKSEDKVKSKMIGNSLAWRLTSGVET